MEIGHWMSLWSNRLRALIVGDLRLLRTMDHEDMELVVDFGCRSKLLLRAVGLLRLLVTTREVVRRLLVSELWEMEFRVGSGRALKSRRRGWLLVIASGGDSSARPGFLLKLY